jgi:hypothetical protein
VLVMKKESPRVNLDQNNLQKFCCLLIFLGGLNGRLAL